VLTPVTSAQEPAAAPNAAVTTGSGPLEATILAEILEVEAAPGDREVRRWVPAQRLSAGDEVHYTVRVRNPGADPVTDVVVTKRLPFGVQYQVGSATGPACDVLFSSDGGNAFAAPERARAGTAKPGARRPVTAPTYTHVRWVLRKPLAPGATALLRFRATFT
jgi:uncharacterized repeat protein (TIGR01451 family)